ncbi:MAG: twin-arginine translocase subunit TatC [Deltaproteobacteria bacterium]|nr:MAG: twin-arginine translocase subunit TatC [Deltaproteobacteria bacterium]
MIPFVLCGTGFFVGGAAFCFFAVLPASFEYLVGMVPTGVESHYSVSVYLSLIMQMVLAFGLIFELPLVMAMLGAAGLVAAQTFAGFRKYWVIAAAFIGGVLTPTPDPMTQLMMAAPLVLFYEVGILGARLFERRRARHKAAGVKGS